MVLVEAIARYLPGQGTLSVRSQDRNPSYYVIYICRDDGDGELIATFTADYKSAAYGFARHRANYEGDDVLVIESDRCDWPDILESFYEESVTA